MNIQNPSTGPARSNPLRSNEAERAPDAEPTTDASSDAAATDDTDTADQVEISDAARTEAASDAALIERSREALGATSLSAERLTELRQRVQEGYYSQPEVTEQVAERLADDIGGAQ